MNSTQIKTTVATHLLAAAIGGYLVANGAGLSLTQRADAATTPASAPVTAPIASAEGKAP